MHMGTASGLESCGRAVCASLPQTRALSVSLAGGLHDIGHEWLSQGSLAAGVTEMCRSLGAHLGVVRVAGGRAPRERVQLGLCCVSYKNSHANNTDAGVLRFVPGNPGINPIQRQVCSEDLSGPLIHDGVHSSILSSELISCSTKAARIPLCCPAIGALPCRHRSRVVSLPDGSVKKKSHTGSAWDSKSHHWRWVREGQTLSAGDAEATSLIVVVRAKHVCFSCSVFA